MKKLTAVLTTLAITFFSASWTPFASAEEVDASDPCAVTICMFGMVTGNADSTCNRAVAKFFSISVVEKGVFMPWKTLDARKNFLAGCRSADSGSTSQILNKFGTKK